MESSRFGENWTVTYDGVMKESVITFIFREI